MKVTQQYSIEELLQKNSNNDELQNLVWNREISEVEWDVSSILGGDWEYNKDEQTITRIS